jgi:TonB family protein
MLSLNDFYKLIALLRRAKTSDRLGRYFLYLLFLLAFAGSHAWAKRLAESYATAGVVQTFDEVGFRRLISRLETPGYPIEAVKSRITGVVVVSVELNSNRTVDKVTILQAPSAAIGRSVVQAVYASRFQELPDVTKNSTKTQGVLTMYFLNAKGSFKVFQPDAAPAFDNP